MLRFFSASIVRQIVAITLALLVFSTAAIVSVTYYNLSAYVMTSAVTDAKDASRAMAVLYAAGDPAAKVDVRDNKLVAVSEEKLPASLSDHALVDRTAASIAGYATVFERQGDDYVRVSTNVKKETVSAPSAPSLPPGTRRRRLSPRVKPITARPISSARSS
jgi:methyl-accepting chemotaxis protein